MNAILYGNDCPSLYSILDDEARGWWYHKKLRKQGEIAEARRRERKSITDHHKQLVKALANGGYATIAQGGGQFSLSYADGAYVTGYSYRLVATAYIVGLPVLDWRHCDDVIGITRLPLPVIGDSKFSVQDMERDRLRPDYPSPFSYVPLAQYLSMAQDVGATVHHYPSSRTKSGQYT